MCNYANQSDRHIEMMFGSLMYDPKYGVPPAKLKDFTREHSSYIEDIAKGFNGQDTWKTVGLFDQTYKDSFKVEYLAS